MCIAWVIGLQNSSYIYTRFIGPPKAGRINKRKILIDINFESCQTKFVFWMCFVSYSMFLNVSMRFSVNNVYASISAIIFLHFLTTKILGVREKCYPAHRLFLELHVRRKIILQAWRYRSTRSPLDSRNLVRFAIPRCEKLDYGVAGQKK